METLETKQLNETQQILGEYAVLPNPTEVDQWLLSLPKNIYNFPIFTPKNIELRESTIIGAGNGVYATEDIKKGEIICEYDGYFKPSKDCDEREKIYTIDAGYGLCIVGDGIGAMINDIVDFRELSSSEAKALFEGNPPKTKILLKNSTDSADSTDSTDLANSTDSTYYTPQHNCLFKFVGVGEFSHIYIIASTDIKNGSELFIPYGFRYWIHRYNKNNYINAELFTELCEQLKNSDLEMCRKKYKNASFE